MVLFACLGTADSSAKARPQNDTPSPFLRAASSLLSTRGGASHAHRADAVCPYNCSGPVLSPGTSVWTPTLQDLADPAAAEDLVVDVEDGGLARSDRALGFVKFDEGEL